MNWRAAWCIGVLACMGVTSVAIAAPASPSPVSATASASDATEALLHKLRERVQAAPVVRGQFEQLKTVKGFKQPLRSSGNFVVAEGKGIAWHVVRPFESTLIVQADSLQSRAADGQVTMQMRAQDEPVLRTVNAMLFAVMAADVTALKEHFQITGQVADAGWKLHLVPRDAVLAQWLSAVELQGDRFVHEVRLQEARGDSSLIRIVNPLAERALQAPDAALFR